MFLPVKREYSPVIDIYLKKYSRGALIEEMDPMAVTTVAGLTHLMTHNPALSYHLAQLSSAGDTEKGVRAILLAIFIRLHYSYIFLIISDLNFEQARIQVVPHVRLQLEEV